jgi:CHAD domain-containing protein
MTDHLHEASLETLRPHVSTIQPDDLMAEAGRRIMLRQFIQILEHEAGAVEGEDIEGVHDMRVATRRIRSTLRLLENSYKPKTVRGLTRSLRKIARALGAVRDLDVLIAEIGKYAGKLKDDQPQTAALTALLETLHQERAVARYDLIRLLDKGEYRRFVEDFSAFLLVENAGTRALDDEQAVMAQVRYALPPMIYQHLGAVRAYDAVLPDAEDEALHALRIEFKRLRYVTSLFDDVLGSQIDDFNKELVKFQDHLGRMQDIVTAHGQIERLSADLPDELRDGLAPYLAALDAEHVKLREDLPALWKKFNAKPVMGKLGAAVAAL